jgi:hypothetical protein
MVTLMVRPAPFIAGILKQIGSTVSTATLKPVGESAVALFNVG